ncbi:SHOCT domain-containing protein [Sphingomonas crocodyli]|uniref:SHOCT domain-containing protein n=1 Tax=Sphingomonas crocodyli TaxID=1979270 RepID=UPI0019D01367|nr:SHOCT domain-containing protein [Sphingomonas crocodyli]
MTDRIEALERLARLKTEGVLTDAEFEQQKFVILGQQPHATHAEPAIGTFAQGWRQTRGLRRFAYWFWGIQLLAILLIAAYFLLRVFVFPEPRPTPTATANIAAPAEANAANASAIGDEVVRAPPPLTGDIAQQKYAGTEITISDEALTSPWNYESEYPDDERFVTAACASATVKLINRSSFPIKAHIFDFLGNRPDLPLPELQPGMTTTFKAGPVGTYVVKKPDDTSFYLLNVIDCPAHG